MSSNPRSDENHKGAYAHLEQSLVAPDEELQATTAIPMIEVVAPATLSEGYKFDAQLGDKSFQVMVPPGGVEAGQKFMVPMPSESLTESMMIPKIKVPVGHWKDGLFGCCAYGPFHNHCLMAAFCPMIAVGQVIHRLKLNIWGKPGSAAETAGVFQRILSATLAYTAFITMISIVCFPFDSVEGVMYTPSFIVGLQVIRTICHYIYLGFLIYISWNVRHYIRQTYAIPEEIKTGLEDLFCAVFCNHCTAAQMLRHTTDYDTYNATCCTEKGVPDDVPDIV